jgi:exonuclease SbcC
MQILSVKIHNILSIENAYLEFSSSGLVLVDGWNFDDEKANGAGKTALFNPICFGLYDKMPRKITATEILRRGTKEGSVEVKLTIKNDTYEVIRERPNKNTFKKNGEVQEWTQEEWENVLGLTYDQFLISMYTVQGTSTKFINLNDSSKKDFLLQLMNLAEFTSCKKETDAKIKELQRELNDTTMGLEKAKSQVTAYQESDVDVHELKHKMINSFSDRQHIQMEIVELRKVNKPDLSKYQDLENKTQSKLSDLIKVRAVREQKLREYNKLESEIGAFNVDDVCFNCGATLDNEEAKKKHEENQLVIKSNMKLLLKELQDLDESLKKEKQLNSLMQQLREKKTRESQDYNAAQNRISELTSADRISDNNFKTWESQVNKASEIKDKIKSLQQYISQVNEIIQKKNTDIELFETISSMYSSTGAPAYILDSIVESFNKTVTEYVELIWPNASYQLKSYKENKKGDVVAKFSETFTNNGQACSIGSISGGEYKALSLAIDFAIIDILGKQFGMALNPIILDEPFDGLDSIGKEIVVELLSKLSKDYQIWIIDHSSEAKTMFSNIVRVEKRNGISVIVNDAV